jgi:hypothetical protein
MFTDYFDNNSFILRVNCKQKRLKITVYLVRILYVILNYVLTYAWVEKVEQKDLQLLKYCYHTFIEVAISSTLSKILTE